MLDDLKYIHERDPQDALGVAEKQSSQLKQSYDGTFAPKTEIRNVVLAGMGGSALPGMFIQTWPGLTAPFEIVRNYTIPKYVDEHTLFISSSYSGTTEESLAALDEAESKNAQIVVVAAGGTLAERANSSGYPLFNIPGGIQPRMSSFAFLAAFASIFSQAGLTGSDVSEELHKTGDWLATQISDWLPDKASRQNKAKQIAQELMGKTVIIYSGPVLSPAANKWKICINENAKNLAWWNQYPEFNHNEFIGWSSHPTDKPFAVVEIRSKLEHPRVQKRFEISEKLISGKRPSPIVVTPEGSTPLEQLVWSIALGDFVSIYLALLNGVNPTPVDLVEKFKLAMTE